MSCSPSAEHSSPNRERFCLQVWLWRMTTVSQAWIAEHLGMKNAVNVTRIICRMALSWIEKKVPETLRGFVSEKMKEPEPQFSRQDQLIPKKLSTLSG
jgi:hypothetical protein